jgi:uncharacterized protein
VKSLAGIKVESAKVLEKGLEYDRRFMLIDANNNAMTQRQFPAMALFKTKIAGETLSVTYLQDSISFPLVPRLSVKETSATVWDDLVKVNEFDSTYSAWFSDKLDIECRLVHFPESNSRPVEEKYRVHGENVSLADAYPLLIIGESSLADLNSRLKTSVPMNRFRPNVVFSGGDAFDEDSWSDFTIGSNSFTAVKSCARCILPNIDQDTAQKNVEPIRTLSAYRTSNNKVYFGQNVLPRSASVIRTGDLITVQSLK